MDNPTDRRGSIFNRRYRIILPAIRTNHSRSKEKRLRSSQLANESTLAITQLLIYITTIYCSPDIALVYFGRPVLPWVIICPALHPTLASYP
jgi:hypothetical protein